MIGRVGPGWRSLGRLRRWLGRLGHLGCLSRLGVRLTCLLGLMFQPGQFVQQTLPGGRQALVLSQEVLADEAELLGRDLDLLLALLQLGFLAGELVGLDLQLGGLFGDPLALLLQTLLLAFHLHELLGQLTSAAFDGSEVLGQFTPPAPLFLAGSFWTQWRPGIKVRLSDRLSSLTQYGRVVTFVWMATAARDTQRRYRAHPAWHLIGAGLVVTWVSVMAAMFWPAERVEAALSAGPDALAQALVDDESWMAAYHKDRKLGYVHSRVERSGQKTVLVQESRLEVSLAGMAQTIHSDLKVELGPDWRLAHLEFSMRAGPVSIRAEGQMVPGGLSLQVDIGGQPGEQVLPMEEAPLFDLALPYLLAKRDLRPGERFRVTVFDPQTLSNRESVVEVIGPEAVQDEDGKLVPAVHLRRSAAGLSLDSWVGASGRVFKEQMEGGLTLLRSTQERATQDLDGPPAVDLSGGDADFLRGLVAPPLGRGERKP